MADIKINRSTVQPVVINPGPGTFFRYPSSSEIFVQLSPSKIIDPLGEKQFHAASLVSGEVTVHEAVLQRVILDELELSCRELLFAENPEGTKVAVIKSLKV